MFGLGKKDKAGSDFSYDGDHELAEQHELIDGYLKQAREQAKRYYIEVPLKDTAAGAAILKLSPEALCGVVMAAQERLVKTDSGFRRRKDGSGYVNTSTPAFRTRLALFFLQKAILRRKLMFTEPQILTLLTWFDESLGQQFNYYNFPCLGIIKALDNYVDAGGETDRLIKPAESIIQKTADHPARDFRKFAERILAIFGMAPDLPIREGEAWGDAAIEYIAKAPEQEKANWAALLAHCVTASGGKPAKRWTQTAEKLAEALSHDAFAAAVPDWFLLVDKPRTQPIGEWPRWQPDPNLMIDDANADILKGLVWTSGIIGDARMAASIGPLAPSSRVEARD